MVYCSADKDCNSMLVAFADAFAIVVGVENHLYSLLDLLHDLLSSHVYLENNIYKLEGRPENLHNNLKTSLILGEIDSDKIPHLIAFIALVIRYTRNWFLDNHAKNYQGAKFEWFYKLGIPSAICCSKNQVINDKFETSLHKSVMLSNIENSNVTLSHIKSVLCEDVSQTIVKSCKVMPEIQAQLIGHVESDAYDPKKRRFIIIDVGGGTADTAVVNLTDNIDGNKDYNCMNSIVKPLGIEMLHKYRLDYIEDSIAKNKVNNTALKDQLVQAQLNSTLRTYPGNISEYFHHTINPINFSIDKLFLQEIPV